MVQRTIQRDVSHSISHQPYAIYDYVTATLCYMMHYANEIYLLEVVQIKDDVELMIEPSSSYLSKLRTVIGLFLTRL